jgi:N6-L-threonylcarbamoyladenine synthase
MSQLILGIESSCDETAASVVDMQGPKMLSNVISSQTASHAKYGGVVPELASREHLRNLQQVLKAALGEAGVEASQLKGIAVTSGPGLAGSLAVGLSAAKALAMAWELPWIGVNHLEGHLLAAFLEHPDLSFPFLGLVVSGGHTSLYAVESRHERRRLASTRDDAAGEAFDKVAKLLGLGFPGGPALDKAAKLHQGGEQPQFPSALMKDKSLDFSYSGLKTSVLHYLERERREGREPRLEAVAAAFQEAAVRPLVKRVLEAARQTGYTRIVVGGGVAANSLLRSELPARAAEAGLKAYTSSMRLCVDNGAMIAYAGGLRLLEGERSPWDLGVQPNWVY